MPRALVCSVLSVNAVLALGGVVYASRSGIPAPLAAPIIAALLLQISFYLLTLSPEARTRLERRLTPAQLGLLIFAAALAPYFVYSIPTGMFRLSSLLRLAAVSAVPAFVFVVWPTRADRLTLQDVLLLTTVAAAELGKIFQQIYVSPIFKLHIEILGRFMILGAGAMAFLSLRHVEGTGYQCRMPAADWRTGFKQFLFFLPAGAVVGFGLDVVGYRPARVAAWMYPLLALATFIGMYLVVAIFEELFFRGILQNLLAKSTGRPVAAQLGASVLYGLSHIAFRSFPNWRYVILTTVLGWFCGQAYRERQSVVASSITHAMVVTVWRVFFAG